MRPPLNAGENREDRRRRQTGDAGFNEAPAERGGKRRGADAHHLAAPLGFNEAPAERGGNSPPTARPPSGWTCFNEAPAERGGKPARAGNDDFPGDPASMRPPLNAGENHH